MKLKWTFPIPSIPIPYSHSHIRRAEFIYVDDFHFQKPQISHARAKKRQQHFCWTATKLHALAVALLAHTSHLEDSFLSLKIQIHFRETSRRRQPTQTQTPMIARTVHSAPLARPSLSQSHITTTTTVLRATHSAEHFSAPTLATSQPPSACSD